MGKAWIEGTGSAVLAEASRALSRAVRYAIETQDERGAWWTSPPPRMFDTGLMACALSRVPSDEAAQAVQRARAWLSTASPQSHHPLARAMEEFPMRLLARGECPLELMDPCLFEGIFARKALFLYVLARSSGVEISAPLSDGEIRDRLRRVHEQRMRLPVKKWGKIEAHAMYTILEALAGNAEGAREACLNLCASMEPDGSFCYNPVSTALAFLALDESMRGSEPWARCLEYILSAQRDDGTWRYFLTDIWDTSLIVRTFGDDQRFRAEALPRALSFLWCSQNEDGGWGFRTNLESDNDTTACVMLALQPSGHSYARALQRATDYLHRVQGADGLWRTWQSYDDEPAKDCVAHIVSALSARHRGAALDLIRARLWLVDQATAPVADPERWRAVWFRSVPYGVLEITRALGPSSALSLSAVRMLAKHQNADGGFGATPGASSTAGDTGLAVAALLQGDDAMGPTVLRGLQYIVDAQMPDGTWASSPSMVGPRPLLIDMPTNSHAFAAHGLSAAVSSMTIRTAGLRGRPLTEANASLSR